MIVSRSRLPPAVDAWLLLIVLWPLGDILRKWGGLNQPIYIIHLFAPLLLIIFLWKRNALRLNKYILIPSMAIGLLTGVLAVFFSISDYSPLFLLVWILNLSALLGPPLLLCCSLPQTELDQQIVRLIRTRIVSLVSISLLLNNLLSVLQSILGRSHFLSVGAGGALDAQITTNTIIELRAPGLFTFASGSALFSVISFIFLIASIGFSLSKRSLFLRFLALVTLPLAVVRSISRFFLFSLLLVAIPFFRLSLRKSFVISLISIVLFLVLTWIVSDQLQSVIVEGYLSFQKRIVDAGGVREGIISRFFSTLVTDSAGSDASLISNLPLWFSSDPLPALFGYGLGFSSPLFRYIMGAEDTAYGFVILGGKEFLVGETAFTSLVADIGLIGIFLYLFLILSVLSVFLKRFFVSPLKASRSYMISFLFALVFSFSLVYFRPSNVLFLCLVLLTPNVCSFLFVNSREFK